MIKINGLSSIPFQSVKIRLENGDIVKLTFRYIRNQRGWFFDVEYKDKKINCIKLTNCPNIIRQYKNILPFGIGCYVDDGYEPWFLEDLENGRVSVYVLTEDDVEYIESEVYGEI